MSDSDRDDDYPGRDDSFDIDIEGFEDLSFPEPKDATEEFPPEALDLELDRAIKRIDEMGTLEPFESPLGFEPPVDPVVIPKPPVSPPISPEVSPPVRPAPVIPRVKEPLAPPLDGGTILLTERLTEEPDDVYRPPSSRVKAPVALAPALDQSPTSVAQLSPKDLSSLIEKAVERGVLRALAIRAAQKKTKA
ncbi:MAG: hypothetical protein LBS60_07475 [Deltaproteobacteria bacterium]|jgi:hypothetical protein|nr:hypothetical protein [Deltaproteobacteria bacterium]